MFPAPSENTEFAPPSASGQEQIPEKKQHRKPARVRAFCASGQPSRPFFTDILHENSPPPASRRGNLSFHRISSLYIISEITHFCKNDFACPIENFCMIFCSFLVILYNFIASLADRRHLQAFPTPAQRVPGVWNALRGRARTTEIPPAKRYHMKQHPRASASPAGVCVTRSRRNNGDPACWRPAREAGFDCAALFGCRARPYTRCAASLRMTRGGRSVRRKTKCRIS